MANQLVKPDFYNEVYKNQNYFQYPRWIYEPYVSSLIAFCGLEKGASVLDVGCGQGFFSYLFSKHGMKVHGIDISETGIQMAQCLYGRYGITFSVADIHTAIFPQQFDCIFVRACSLYNTEAFPFQNGVTSSLIRHLKSSGAFIFAYNSNFSSKVGTKWRYHSLDDVKQHFSSYDSAQFFFVNKITTSLLREHSFSPFLSRMNILLSKVLGMGGDLICILREPRSPNN